jgi:prolyl-tRNA synthetase
MIIVNNTFLTSKSSNKRSGFELLENAGYIKKMSSGFYTYLPLGLKLIQNISNVVRSFADSFEFNEISTPILQEATLWQTSGRLGKYTENIFSISDNNGQAYIVSPTCEEVILSLYSSISQNRDILPWRVFQVGERERNEDRPAFGLIRSKSFILADFYSLTKNQCDAENEIIKLSSIIQGSLSKLEIKFEKAKYSYQTNTLSFWTESKSKQCNLVICKNCNGQFRYNQEFTICPDCQSKQLSYVNGVELADASIKGTEISAAIGAKSKQDEPVFLTVAGIGISRLAQIAAEQHCDDQGLLWPLFLAPYEVYIISNSDRQSEAKILHEKLVNEGVQTVADFRDLSMGKKLIDANLIGSPIHVILGNHTEYGIVELNNRLTNTKLNLSVIDALCNILKRGMM